MTQDPYTGYTPPPQPPRRRRHIARWVLLGFVAVFALIIGIAAGNSGKKQAATPITTASDTAVPSVTEAAPSQSPDGTFKGACDYILGDDPSGGTAVATGDVQVQNTGNIGTIVKVTITWPQQGFKPLSKSTTIKVPAGATADPQFNYHLTSDQLDLLQAYQTGHLGETGCTYDATITGTYGTVSSS